MRGEAVVIVTLDPDLGMEISGRVYVSFFKRVSYGHPSVEFTKDEKSAWKFSNEVIARGVANTLMKAGYGKAEVVSVRDSQISERVAKRVIRAAGLVDMDRNAWFIELRVYGVHVSRMDLKSFLAELAVEESKLNAAAMKVEAWAKKQGIKAKREEMFILAGDGEISIVINFDKMVDYEYETLHI